MLSLFSKHAKAETAQDKLDQLAAPPVQDPLEDLYLGIRDVEEALDVSIPTVGLGPGQIKNLRSLLARYRKGEPVAGVIVERYALEGDEKV